MSKSLKGTQTELNLLKAFAGESQARNRYEFFVKVAKNEGYEQIAAIFQETANQEKEPPRGKTKNGPYCIPLLRRRQRKKVFLKSPRHLK
jgi:hypothetical protein